MKSTCPGSPRWPNTTSMATRMPITIMPMRRKKENERAQGALVRREDTTNTTTAAIRARSSGLVVLMAATAMPAAQAHQASGCSARGAGESDRRPLTPCPAGVASEGGRRAPGRRRPPR